MKKLARIMIPVILVIAILFCTAWYLFIYDRGFTRDMLLVGARYFDSNGNHELSSWLYDLAYKQAGDDDAVAIELAEQHKKSGNYTKAEYTLSKAIADGASADLYIALCKTYIEQDKVLDAVSMLNNISNPEIKAQLDTMRPAAPTSSPQPGFYNQYISVIIEADVPTILVNANGEYPSVYEDLYTAPIQLQQGENVIYAVAVSKECLVSPLAIYGFTVGGVIEEVVFNDDVLESAIRQQLSVGEQTILYSNDLWQLTEFTIPDGTENYDVLRFMTYLEKLTIDNGCTGQLSVLSHLSNLNTLSITNTQVQPDELTLIATLPNLTALTLNNCSLSTISGLENAGSMQSLDLSNNTIRDLSPLSSMEDLEHLNLAHNAVNDISALSNLKQISTLDVSYNSLSTLEAVAQMSKLAVLNARNNTITSIVGVDRCTNLVQLTLSNNRIEDVSALSVCKALTHLYADNNNLTQLDSLAELPNLTNLYFANNQVTDLPAFSKSSKLVNIDGSNNLIASLDPLEGLQQLNNVFMDYNAEISSVQCLVSCPVLIQVNVYGTKVNRIEDVTDLTKQSVIVNFNPTEIETPTEPES